MNTTNLRSSRLLSSQRSPTAFGLSILFLSLLTALGEPEEMNTLPSLSTGFRNRLGKVVVVSRGQPAQFTFQTSVGRVRYASDGAQGVAWKMLHPISEIRGFPDSAVLATVPAVLSPIGAAVGGVSARNEVLSATDLRNAEASLTACASNVCRQSELQQAFLTLAREQTHCAWPAGPEPVPPEFSRAEYRRLSDLGFDTALELQVTDLRLERLSASDTSYALFIDGHARLVRTRDGAVLYDEPFHYRSGTSLFLDWTLNGAEPFRLVVTRGYQRVAAAALESIFVKGDASILTVKGNARAVRGPSHNATAQRRAAPKTGIVELKASALSPELVTGMGQVGVISTSSVPDRLVMQRPLNKDQASDYALASVRDLCAPGDGAFDELLQVPVVNAVAAGALVPISVALQTANGIRSLRPEKLIGADANLTRVSNGFDLHASLRAAVTARIQALTRSTVQIVKQPLPRGAEEECMKMSCFRAGTLAWVPQGQTPSYYLRSQGVDTALELSVSTFALSGEGVVNPPLAVTLGVRASLIRVEKGECFYSASMKYRSAERKFVEWAANDGQALREELDRCVATVSAALVDELGVPAWSNEKPIELAADPKEPRAPRAP